MSAVRSIGASRSAPTISPSVARTIRSSGQEARATTAAGQSGP